VLPELICRDIPSSHCPGFDVLIPRPLFSKFFIVLAAAHGTDGCYCLVQLDLHNKERETFPFLLVMRNAAMGD
jgi:hypothetical protein